VKAVDSRKYQGGEEGGGRRSLSSKAGIVLCQ
jgi:hypothetical protein